MTRLDHDTAILTAHRELASALRDEDHLLAELTKARARREAAEGRLRQLARTEPGGVE